MLSPSDTAIVFVVALLLFGPEQMPKIARQVGEAMRKLQSTTQSFMVEMERAASTDDARPPDDAKSRDELAEAVASDDGTEPQLPGFSGQPRG
ncbi:MAG: twin-arginine translocase TatA/TatE family subunit [Candidatus Eremiobacteraeota bacterium]|nr:twin-arginine translocase TatA/TatE family subunit [Candidatus Eremiobacteraeota bacterium]MBC5828111.1 twin-arginine translocase TatA/TatE family subunit [Candidatus Eremiobacteraeota bacterium]